MTKKSLILLVAVVLLSVGSHVFATTEDTIASFKQQSAIVVPELKVPSVIEFLVPDISAGYKHLGIYNLTTKIFVPYTLLEKTPEIFPTAITKSKTTAP